MRTGGDFFYSGLTPSVISRSCRRSTGSSLGCSPPETQSAAAMPAACPMLAQMGMTR